MYILSVAEAKKHLNVEDYFTDDDNYINMLINVAFNSIKNRCNQVTWTDHSGNTSGATVYADNSAYQIDIPMVVKHAMLLLVGNFYANREPVAFASSQTIPYTIEYLLSNYINFGDLTTTTTTTII